MKEERNYDKTHGLKVIADESRKLY